MYYESSRFRGQRSRSQRDITRLKVSITQPEMVRFRSHFVTPDVLQNVQGQRVKCRRYQHQEIVTFHERISWLSLNFVKIIPQHSETRDTLFKVIRSNTETTITPPQIVRFRSNLVVSFRTSQARAGSWSLRALRHESDCGPLVLYLQYWPYLVLCLLLPSLRINVV